METWLLRTNALTVSQVSATSLTNAVYTRSHDASRDPKLDT